MKVLVTGSNGLIGSEAVAFYADMGCDVIGFDNDMRAQFFGSEASTKWVGDRLLKKHKNYLLYDIDIRDFDGITRVFREIRPQFIIHCAAQPSHDRAADIPFDDFAVNASGTHNLLEAARHFCPYAPFIHMSTNKVYGDNPNHIPLVEFESRYEYADRRFLNGIPETMSIDHCCHSLFGVSKTAGDLLAQEYGRYFDLNVGVFRGGCLTGPAHSSVELHGFLSYLVKCMVHNRPYTIFGHKGKQVRDQIHAKDVISAFEAFRKNPKQGEVFNLGGGKTNSISILESIRKITFLTDSEFTPSYSEDHRIGDHICYYTDLTKFQSDYPNWSLTISVDQMIQEMIDFELGRK